MRRGLRITGFAAVAVRAVGWWLRLPRANFPQTWEAVVPRRGAGGGGVGRGRLGPEAEWQQHGRWVAVLLPTLPPPIALDEQLASVRLIV